MVTNASGPYWLASQRQTGHGELGRDGHPGADPTGSRSRTRQVTTHCAPIEKARKAGHREAVNQVRKFAAPGNLLSVNTVYFTGIIYMCMYTNVHIYVHKYK